MSPPSKLTSNFSFDRIVWLNALPEHEYGPTRRMVEDIEAAANRAGILFREYRPQSSYELSSFLDAERMAGGKPLIHLDSHGSETGISIGDHHEDVSWKFVCAALRPINIVSNNQLLVVSNCCFGIFASHFVSLTEPAPFLGFIGPVDIIRVGEFEHSIPAFYQSILEQDDLLVGMKELSKFDFWLAEQFLLTVLVNYLKNEGSSFAKSQFVEELVSKAKATGNILLTERVTPYRKDFKRLLKEELGPKLLEDRAQTFLLGNKPEFTYSDLLRLAQE